MAHKAYSESAGASFSFKNRAFTRAARAFPGKGSPGMPAKEKEDGKFAGTMFKWHTWMGQYIFYLLPVHVGAVGLHTFKGQPILSRINPLASPK